MTAPLAASHPDADELTRDLIARLRAVLVEDLATQEQHFAELRTTAESLRGQRDQDSLLERELAEGSAAQRLEVIVDIKDALIRIKTGTYGRCQRCGEPIAPARLEAIPHTRHCISCPPLTPRRLG